MDGWVVERDPENRMGPYAYSSSEWVGFDDIDSVVRKLDYLIDLGLGGAMAWALDLDDFSGSFCPAQEKYPLLKTINRGLGFLDHSGNSAEEINEKILKTQEFSHDKQKENEIIHMKSGNEDHEPRMTLYGA